MRNLIYKEVYKRSVAMQLKEMGNPIQDARVNFKNPSFVVYMFEKTDKLFKDLDKIK